MRVAAGGHTRSSDRATLLDARVYQMDARMTKTSAMRHDRPYAKVGSSGTWSSPRRLTRSLVLAALAAAIALPSGALAQSRPTAAATRSGAIEKGPSGLPLPRFVSLKLHPVNMRKGPGTTYKIDWVLRRAGMPLEILREYGNWRQVRDADGTTGWVHRAFLSGRRTASVAPWTIKSGQKREVFDLTASRSSTGRVVARVEAGSVLDVGSCDGTWCDVWAGDYRGFVRQQRLWGIYQGEAVE